MCDLGAFGSWKGVVLGGAIIACRVDSGLGSEGVRGERGENV